MSHDNGLLKATLVRCGRFVAFATPVALAAAVGVVRAQGPQNDAQALQRMVATERAFAAATEHIGVRDGFLSFFADDAIAIRRGREVTLEPARDGLAAQPLPKLPIANTLLWEPFTGMVSADGTLGWLTGAFVSFNQAQKTPVGQGAYFSVWKRQPNGTWRVWLDEGIRLPQIWRDASPFRVFDGSGGSATADGSVTIADLERAVAAGGEAWRDRLADGVRLHRDGIMPVVGREAVVAWAASQLRVAHTVLRIETAGSGDLAITLGAYEAMTTTGPERGSWVRAWHRDSVGRWRIVFETRTSN